MVKKQRVKNDSPAKKFFRGDVNLVMSFWGVYIGGGLAVGFVLGFIFPFPPIILYLIIITWTIYSMIGTWRASDKYRGKKLWAYLTKAWIILGIIQTIIRTPYWLQ